jgi:hypothetical protein
MKRRKEGKDWKTVGKSGRLPLHKSTLSFRGQPPANADPHVFCEALRKARHQKVKPDVEAILGYQRSRGWPMHAGDSDLRFKADPKIPPWILDDWILRGDFQPDLLLRSVSLDELGL